MWGWVNINGPYFVWKFTLDDRSDDLLLTSDELSSEGNRIVDAEAALGSHCKTILLLIKAYVADFICTSRCSSCHIFVEFFKYLGLM